MKNSDQLLALQKYEKLAGEAIIEATFLYDRTVAACKMMSWECVGDDNQAWKEGPCLTSGANCPQIDRSYPYIMTIGIETKKATELVLGSKPKRDANGGVRIPLAKSSPGNWASEKPMAKLAIIMQFELYKQFCHSVQGPYNQGTAKQWQPILPEIVSTELHRLTNRRNELIHDETPMGPTMKEAVEYFNSMRWIAQEVTDHWPTFNACKTK